MIFGHIMSLLLTWLTCHPVTSYFSQMDTTLVTYRLVLTADFSAAASLLLLVSSSPSHCIMRHLLSNTLFTHSSPPLNICQMSLNLDTTDVYSRVSHYLWSQSLQRFWVLWSENVLFNSPHELGLHQVLIYFINDISEAQSLWLMENFPRSRLY